MKRAKKPPSISSKGTNWGTFSSCQGDDNKDKVCVFESSKNVKVFLLGVLALVNKLFDGAKKENEDILLQKIDLKKVQFDLQTFTQTLKGGMLNRKKSL